MRFTLGFPLVAAVCVCSMGWAQERREERRAERAAPAVRREAGDKAHHAVGSADQQIAALLHLCARNEVEISKIAEEKGTSEEVRNFAAMMVKEHSMCLEKMQKAAGPLASAHAHGTPGAAVKKEVIKEEATEEKREEPRRDPAAKTAKNAPREVRRVATEERTTIDTQVAGAHGLDWMMVHKQIADQCLETTKTELGKKEGAEFDHCYMGQQVMAHLQMIDHLKVLSTHASAELRTELEESSKTLVTHLEHAKKITENMKGETERVSRKPKAE